MRQPAAVSLWRKLLSSVAAAGVAGGLIAFATFGAFDDAHDPFPHSVAAP